MFKTIVQRIKIRNGHFLYRPCCRQFTQQSQQIIDNNNNENRETNEHEQRVQLYNSIENLNKSKTYKLYPFVSPLLLGPMGYYLLDIVAAPLELQMTILIAPITMDIIHWTVLNKSLRNVNINNLQIFGNRLKNLSTMSWTTALVAQSIAFGLVMINPLESVMIDSLSVYGQVLVTLSPMTPMLFTLISHETIFQFVRNEITKVK
eukprot:303847_1